MVDWQPLIVALAAVLIAVATAIPALVVAITTRAAVARVEKSTDGNLTAATARVAALEAQVAALAAAAGGRRSGE